MTNSDYVMGTILITQDTPFTLFDFDSNLVNISYTPCNDNGPITYIIIMHDTK